VLALSLIAIAVLVACVELARHHDLAEASLLAALLALIGLAGRFLLRDLRTHPANFPAPSASQGLRLHR
jgi:hypothetical protein